MNRSRLEAAALVKNRIFLAIVFQDFQTLEASLIHAKSLGVDELNIEFEYQGEHHSGLLLDCTRVNNRPAISVSCDIKSAILTYRLDRITNVAPSQLAA